ncbi:hypothetical protein NF552_24195 (plasmid) [Roseomonas mucosa]|nr:hypothetical protein NF552_24195 [Roseomonas mucosa]
MHLSARPPAPAAPLEQASGLSAGIPLTVAMALAEVARWDDLTPTRRRDLASALRGVCRLADLPPAAVELSPVFLRERVFDRTATHHGVKRPTMCTLRSALRYVLRRLGLMDPADAPLSPAWRAALAGLPAYRPYGLIAFARFCSVRGVAPEAVDDAALADFEAWLTERNLTPKPRKTAGDVRGGWNRACREVADWPGRPLGRLARPKAYVLPPEAFPASFRADLEAFRRRLGSNVLDLPEPGSAEEENRLLDMRPLRPSTVAMRVDHARWAASALVASGAVPMEQITSLRDLVSPFGRIEAAIGFLYRRAEAAEGERERRPSAAGHHVAEVLRIIAKHHGALSPRQLERLQGWRDRVALKYDGMTLRNERTMQAILQPDKLTALLELPGVLMGAARRLRDEAPPQARSLAMRALAIAILTHLPLRLANLAGLDLDRNLYRPDPRRGAITELWIPPGDQGQEGDQDADPGRALGADPRMDRGLPPRHPGLPLAVPGVRQAGRADRPSGPARCHQGGDRHACRGEHDAAPVPSPGSDAVPGSLPRPLRGAAPAARPFLLRDHQALQRQCAGPGRAPLPGPRHGPPEWRHAGGRTARHAAG